MAIPSLEEFKKLADQGNLIPVWEEVHSGPCSPKEAGISVEAIRHFSAMFPVLGICLGHQAIGYAFGGESVSSGIDFDRLRGSSDQKLFPVIRKEAEGFIKTDPRKEERNHDQRGNW